MRTTRSVSILLPSAELRQAKRLARETNRSLSGVFREGLKRLQRERRALGRLADNYTPEQRRIINAGIAEGMEDFRRGRFYGPFDTADEAISSIQANLKQRAAAKKPKAPTR